MHFFWGGAFWQKDQQLASPKDIHQIMRISGSQERGWTEIMPPLQTVVQEVSPALELQSLG